MKTKRTMFVSNGERSKCYNNRRIIRCLRIPYSIYGKRPITKFAHFDENQIRLRSVQIHQHFDFSASHARSLLSLEIYLETIFHFVFTQLLFLHFFFFPFPYLPLRSVWTTNDGLRSVHLACVIYPRFAGSCCLFVFRSPEHEIISEISTATCSTSTSTLVGSIPGDSAVPPRTPAARFIRTIAVYTSIKIMNAPNDNQTIDGWRYNVFDEVAFIRFPRIFSNRQQAHCELWIRENPIYPFLGTNTNSLQRKRQTACGIGMRSPRCLPNQSK